MERCDDSLPGGNENSRPIADIDSQSSILSSNLFLDGVGEVVVTLNSDGLSCRSAESISNVSFFHFVHLFSLIYNF